MHLNLKQPTNRLIAGGLYNPFPTYPFSGSVRPVYPLSPRRPVPKSIKHPDWAETGIPKRELRLSKTKWDFLDVDGQAAMRKACRLAREVLDITAAAVKPGVTTDYLDEVCHNACVERQVGCFHPAMQLRLTNAENSPTLLHSTTITSQSHCVHLQMKSYAMASPTRESFLMATFSIWMSLSTTADTMPI